jgi:hypothetical protein
MMTDREQEREKFKAANPHLDLAETLDGWDKPMFKHSHVDAMFYGWMQHAALAQPVAAVGDARSVFDTWWEDKYQNHSHFDAFMEGVKWAHRGLQLKIISAAQPVVMAGDAKVLPKDPTPEMVEAGRSALGQDKDGVQTPSSPPRPLTRECKMREALWLLGLTLLLAAVTLLLTGCEVDPAIREFARQALPASAYNTQPASGVAPSGPQQGSVYIVSGGRVTGVIPSSRQEGQFLYLDRLP